jgi:hypothetical protein
VQNQQRHDLVGEKGSDYLGGQPRQERFQSELLDKVPAKQEQQLFSDQ